MRLPLLCLLAAILITPLRAAEPPPSLQGERQKPKGEKESAQTNPPSPSAFRPSPFFRPGDVIALVGGEDMVVASEYGYLELLLTRALPDYHLRFRNLAWEGDTVFEQRRDLNFPTYEEQLDKIGATVVIAQFGQMESLAAAQEPRRRGDAEGEKAAVAEFIAAYEKLIERFSGGGKRRVALLAPLPFEVGPQPFATRSFLESRHEVLARYDKAIASLAKERGTLYVNWLEESVGESFHRDDRPLTRDSVHLSEAGQSQTSKAITQALGLKHPRLGPGALDQISQLIIAKNRLWFDYWRPQNWAFLAGDRTAQPSSRDHLDPSKRWFPPEREAFLPLIEAKEKEIDALAVQLAQP